MSFARELQLEALRKMAYAEAQGDLMGSQKYRKVAIHWRDIARRVER